VAECYDYAKLTKEIAIFKNCAFYDYYNVSGNRFSMLKWSASKLAQYDRTHLTTAGYYVRGELCLNAILNSYYTSLIRKNPDTLLISKIDTAGFHTVSKNFQTNNLVYSGNKSSFNNPDNDTIIKKLPVLVNTQKVYTPVITEGNETAYYIVKPGDNLGSIAQKFHVSMTQIKQWNNIKGTNIIAGKTLVIYKKKYYYSPNPNNNQVNNNNTNKTNNTQYITNQNNSNNVNKGKQIKHKVVSGDNMWDISRKYHVSMEQIRKLNNMKDNNLKVGSYLIISN
jgi:LysM repeat protein